ncbi:hypothetical protein ACQ4N8_23905, partial [Paenibacillus macerans]
MYEANLNEEGITMRITIDTGLIRTGTEALVCPIYEGEDFAWPLREKCKQPGAVAWFYGRAAGEEDVLAVGLGRRERATLERTRRAGGCAARALLREE